MYSKELKKGIDHYMNNMINSDAGWGYHICERAYDACDHENYYLGNMMDLYIITSTVFGMHTQDKIIISNQSQ